MFVPVIIFIYFFIKYNKFFPFYLMAKLWVEFQVESNYMREQQNELQEYQKLDIKVDSQTVFLRYITSRYCTYKKNLNSK